MYYGGFLARFDTLDMKCILIHCTVPGISGDVVYKKLFPIVWDDVVKAKRLAVDEYVKGEKKKSLEYLYVMNKQIVRCENKIARSIRELDKMKSERKKFEFQMGTIRNFCRKKIKATRIHKEVPYMLTDEAEHELISEERKRKREEEEEELKRKRYKVVETKDDKVVDDKDVTEEESKDTEHDKKLLQSLLKTQENLSATAGKSFNGKSPGH